MSNVFIKPVDGAKVRDPDTQNLLADDGEWKALNTFWRRRLRDKDVIETKVPTEKRAVASKLPPAAS